MCAHVSHSFLKRLGQENRVRSWKSEEEEELASSSSQSKDFSKRRSLLSFRGIWDRKKNFFAGGKGRRRKEIVSVVMDFLFRGGIPHFYSFFEQQSVSRMSKRFLCIFTAFI